MVAQMTEERRREIWAKITAQAWEDEGYKQKLLSSPQEELAANGLTFPEGYSVKLVEEGSAEAQEVGLYAVNQKSDGNYEVTMRLAKKPADLSSGELSDSELEAVAGGGDTYCCCCSCCPCCTCS